MDHPNVETAFGFSFIQPTNLYPTVSAGDWKYSAALERPSTAKRLGYLGPFLKTLEQRNGVINPDWAESLMGYPIGWTLTKSILHDRPSLLDSSRPNYFVAPPDSPQYDWEPPRLISAKLEWHDERMIAIGNSVIPQIVQLLGYCILQMEKDK